MEVYVVYECFASQCEEGCSYGDIEENDKASYYEDGEICYVGSNLDNTKLWMANRASVNINQVIPYDWTTDICSFQFQTKPDFEIKKNNYYLFMFKKIVDQ